MENFVKNFVELFDNTDPSLITSTTVFKNLEEYSSLLALSIVAMVDENYGVRIKGEDIKSSTTIEDLYKVVQSRV